MSDEPKRPDRGMTHIGDALDNVMGSLFPPGELPAVIAPAQKTKGRAGEKAARQPNAKLAAAAAEIVARPAISKELAYITRELVQCSFPLRDPGDVPAWVRRNGNISLVIQPGFDAKTGKSMGLPYGEWVRVILPYLGKKVVESKSPIVKLDRTFNDFLRVVGGNPETGRGKRGDAKRLKEQWRRLIHSRISFQYAEGTAQKGREAFINMEVAKSAHLWWDFKNPDQEAIFESEIVLGDLLFQAFTSSKVPVDFRALLALKRSLNQASFSMDVYTWSQARIFQMRDATPARDRDRIPLKYLAQQFGAEYSRLRDFKSAFEEALIHAQHVFPALGYEFDGQYFDLIDLHGRPAVLSKDPARASRRMAQLANQITPAARQWFQAHYPLHKVQEAEADFNYWRDNPADGVRIESFHPDKHFKNLVQKHWITQKEQG